MITALLEIAAWFAGVGGLTVAVWRGFRRRETPRPAPRRNYDALAPVAPLYGARRLPTRPLRPYTADEEAIIATVWGDGTRVLARPASTPERN